jgi:hypothetical protein
MEGRNIIGDVGHCPRHYLPVHPEPVQANLDGRWASPEGAVFDIEDSALVMGVGPVRHRMALTALGAGRYLFTLRDGPWTKRVCLHQFDTDRVELVLSRARMIEYVRQG